MDAIQVVINAIGAVVTGVMAVHYLKANRPRLAAMYGTLWLILAAVTAGAQIILWVERS